MRKVKIFPFFGLIFAMFFLPLIANVPILAGVDEIFKNHTELTKPLEMRDPFEAPKFKQQTISKTNLQNVNQLDNTEQLAEAFSLEKIQILGVLLGKERRVLIQHGSKDTVYTFKEDDEIGTGGPKIKAILAGGVVLVEKITNIYGDDEYIETVVPISR